MCVRGRGKGGCSVIEGAYVRNRKTRRGVGGSTNRGFTAYVLLG